MLVAVVLTLAIAPATVLTLAISSATSVILLPEEVVRAAVINPKSSS